MQIEDMVLVSIDDHVIEPANMFERHIPAKYRDDAPTYVHDTVTGNGHWVFQGLETGMSGLGAVASWPHEEWDFDPTGFPEMRPATYDADLRVRDMDANGVLGGDVLPDIRRLQRDVVGADSQPRPHQRRRLRLQRLANRRAGR